MSQQCPFLSTMEEKVTCFKECAFYEFEGSGEGCPFRKVKGRKSLSIKEILSFDLEEEKNDDYDGDDFERDGDFLDDRFIKEYL